MDKMFELQLMSQVCKSTDCCGTSLTGSEKRVSGRNGIGGRNSGGIRMSQNGRGRNSGGVDRVEYYGRGGRRHQKT